MNTTTYTGGFNVSVGKRYAMLLYTWLLCFLLSSVVIGFLQSSGPTPTKMRIAILIQDLMMFVIPAIATAVVIARRPDQFLMVASRPGWVNSAIVVIILLMSSPLMQAIIDWNQSIRLPESLSGLSQWIDASEDRASEQIDMVMGGGSIGSLIISILMIGILAGFSEEIFFRGTLQRIISTSSSRKHLAVWLTALIFSLMHFQFYGFVPRMLLGGFFGYLALWSGSLWLAVIGHVANNIIAVIAMWTLARSGGAVDIDAAASVHAESPLILSVSAALTAFWIVCLYKRLHTSH